MSGWENVFEMGLERPTERPTGAEYRRPKDICRSSAVGRLGLCSETRPVTRQHFTLASVLPVLSLQWDVPLRQPGEFDLQAS